MPALLLIRTNRAARHGRLLIPGLLLGVLLVALPAEGQLINVGAPFNRSGDSSFGRTGVSFGMSFGGGNRLRGLNAAGQLTPNIMISQGSAGTTIPPFGGYDPNADLRTGFALVGSDIGFSFGLVAGKGNSRSIVSNTPSVTMFNGQSGSIFSGELRPFVTAITPVPGGAAGMSLMPPSGLPEGFEIPRYPERPINTAPQVSTGGFSTASSGALSLAEIERQKAARLHEETHSLRAEIDQLVTEARELVEKGNYGAARVRYTRALRRMVKLPDADDLKEVVFAEFTAIRDKR